MEWVPVIWEAILAQSIIVESIRPTTIPTHYANTAESHFDNICSTEFNAARASNVLQDDLCKTLFCDHLCNKQTDAKFAATVPQNAHLRALNWCSNYFLLFGGRRNVTLWQLRRSDRRSLQSLWNTRRSGMTVEGSHM